MLKFIFSWILKKANSITKNDILLLEKEFNLSLPDDYINVLLNYPNSLRSDDGLGPDFYQLICHSNELIKENKEIVKRYNGNEEYPRFVWKKDFFLIGVDGCGGFYFIDLKENPSPVFYYDHEIDEYSEFSSNIQEYVKYRIELLQEFEGE